MSNTCSSLTGPVTNDEPKVVRPIWHEDGDIVLSVKDGKIEQQFLVHQQMLRRTSHVFRDMLAMPQSANAEGSAGYPVVPLDDSPADLRALLRALYDGLSSLFRDNQLTHDVMLSILRLSDKYGMEDLRCGITRLLMVHWPLNHSDYLARQKLYESGSGALEAMKLIRTAYHCQVAELLPAAFYEVVASQSRGWREVEINASRRLSPAILSRLLVGRERSQRRLMNLVVWTDNVMPVLWNPHAGATPATILTTRASLGRCQGIVGTTTSFGGTFYCYGDIFPTLKTKVGAALMRGRSAFDIILSLQRGDFPCVKACTPCNDWIKSVLANKMQELWENIPVDFDLPKIDPKMYSGRISQPF